MNDDPLLSTSVFAPPPPSQDQTTSYGPLHPGSSWSGIQKSGRSSYSVRVTIHTVTAHSLTGLLEINGLTPELESLVTFFDGEIVGTEKGFLTGKWGAKEGDDLRHWNRFAGFRGLKGELKKPHLTYTHHDRPFIFMRWKEQFVVPEYKVQNINGASFAGFYFLCLELNTPTPSSLRTATSPPPSHSPRRPSLLIPSRPLATPLGARSPTPSAETTRPNTPTVSTTRAIPIVRRQPFSYAAIVRRGSDTSSSSPPSSVFSTSPSTSITSEEEPDEEDHDDYLSPSASETPSGLVKEVPLPSFSEDDFPPPPSSPPLPTSALPPMSPSSSRRGLGLRRASSSGVVPGIVVSTTTSVGKRERGRSAGAEDTFSRSSSAAWPHARITGFYYFKHSEPFQELELTYEPSPVGGGMGGGQAGTGSGCFGFR